MTSLKGEEETCLTVKRSEIFLRFLDTASDRELVTKRSELEALVGVLLSGTDARSDARYFLRLLAEEQAARISVPLARERHRQQR